MNKNLDEKKENVQKRTKNIYPDRDWNNTEVWHIFIP